jgi:Holliday junction resolvase RusA-like endonuclease
MLSGPLIFQARFYLPRPKSAYRVAKKGVSMRSGLSLYHTSKPDTDNLVKLLLDSCNKVVFQDDSQVVELLVTKAWCDNKIYKEQNMEGVHIHVREVAE